MKKILGFRTKHRHVSTHTSACISTNIKSYQKFISIALMVLVILLSHDGLTKETNQGGSFMNQINALSIILIFGFGFRAHADLSAMAGQTLLESFRFRCESTNGSAVQGVQTSLTSLRSTLEKIADQQKECQADLAAVGKLPEIDSILRQIDNYISTEEIRKQETIITEALNDLAIVKRMPADHPDRAPERRTARQFYDGLFARRFRETEHVKKLRKHSVLL